MIAMGTTVRVDADPQVPEAPITLTIPLAMTATADEDVQCWLTVDEATQLSRDLTAAVMQRGAS